VGHAHRPAVRDFLGRLPLLHLGTSLSSASPPLADAHRRAATLCFGRNREPHYLGASVRSWDSTVGQDGESMIAQGWRKSVAMSHPFQLGVAKTIHLSGKAVTSALDPGHMKTQRNLVHQGQRNTEARYMAFMCAPPLHNGPLQTRNRATTPPTSANRCFHTAWVGNGRSCPDTPGSANQATLVGGV